MALKEAIQLGEFCRRLNDTDRQVRYILEQGFVPRGVPEAPSTGNHRQFEPGHAFWLAMVVKLKQSGVKTPLAARIADRAMDELRRVTQNLSWEWSFDPRAGRFDTVHQYFVEVGDLKLIRFVTDANPSKDGLYFFPWFPITGRRKPVEEPQPFVVLRLDLTRIAKTLGN
jgi:hypothetical protein